ncbi:uncharacterized protein BT62DRAFT_933942 [Guyanagaster necrorhizus]|uniref:DNA-directed RNA polymerase III subunit RPC4 n=1 Tax=Guyanagaster necrorhizus TaxID=856835 RepID=A0A9P7VP30_9AGAR|nr:uncharacterized protein BT62DRAFT_933942 [Guyanagaster necrorhizus MCA 3950]KAG7444279.1 hypothetical protein BT62DRAFT_933942 [Guyanagaster necrorhizus MCA 3950]
MSNSNVRPSTTTSKAISSLAKRPSEVTRQGTQKLKFVPTLPSRRKKEEVKLEPTAEAVPPARGRGRGRGDATRGRGVPRQQEMTASGPFALGPAMSGNTATRRRPVFIAVPSTRPSTSSLSSTPAPRIKSEGKDKDNAPEDDEASYSDPDEGVEIIDMENVKNMDWMAPESLKRAKATVNRPKKEEQQSEVDASNALNLSESEEEEELEDIIEDFAQQAPEDPDDSLRQDRLYFFQFPAPFPTFALKGEAPPLPPPTDKKKVSFAPTVKAEVPTPATEKKEKPVVDGMIGRLEIYRSGAVKMRLTNGILLDVMAATQPSFLQHAVSLDMKEKKLNVLGEVNKRFVVVPDVDGLLEAMERAEREPRTVLEGEEGLIKMDMT